jgi:hypothetical protein
MTAPQWLDSGYCPLCRSHQCVGHDTGISDAERTAPQSPPTSGERHYAAHRGEVHFMNGPYQMGLVGKAATFEDAEKFAAALESLAHRVAPSAPEPSEALRSPGIATPAVVEERLRIYYRKVCGGSIEDARAAAADDMNALRAILATPGGTEP